MYDHSKKSSFGYFAIASFALLFSCTAYATTTDDQAAVAALDTEFQAATKNNDAATINRIVADDFILVLANGKTYTKADLLKSAKEKESVYEHQEDSQRTVRVWLDTAAVTAVLWAKGKDKDGAFDYKLWFSDIYVRTPTGWHYVFGQAGKAPGGR